MGQEIKWVRQSFDGKPCLHRSERDAITRPTARWPFSFWRAGMPSRSFGWMPTMPQLPMVNGGASEADDRMSVAIFARMPPAWNITEQAATWMSPHD